jgi:hypothetical protein
MAQGKIAQAAIGRSLADINTKILDIFGSMSNDLNSDSEDDDESPTA